jgi:hypothetical protein
MLKRGTSVSFCAVVLTLLIACGSSGNDKMKESRAMKNGKEVSGTYAPDGPPSTPPERVDAGKSCIVDLEQGYKVSGALDGTFKVNYRILVHGPFGSPIGTFDESWIAYGEFSGSVKGQKKSGSVTYTADVKAGGDVSGKLVFGQGMEGELTVSGNFGDGKLSYQGHIAD